MAQTLASLTQFKFARTTELLRPMLQQGVAVKWSANPDNTDLVLSPGWRDMYGGESLSLIRQGWIYLVHPDHRLKTIQRWLTGRLSERPYQSVNLTLVHGVYRPVTSLVFPVIDSRGDVVRWEGYNQLLDDDLAANF